MTKLTAMFQIKSFIILAVYSVKAYIKFVRPISTSLGQRQHSLLPFEEMLRRWQAVGNTVSDLTGPRFESQPPTPGTNALPLDQLASNSNI